MTSPLTRRTGVLSLFAIALILLPAGIAHAQTADTNSASPDCSKMATHIEITECARTHSETRTIFLKNVTEQNDANEIMVAIRNSFDPGLRLYLVASQNALVVTSYPQELDKVEALARELDRPMKTYRLTYTLTELDGNKTISTGHYSMVMVAGQETVMKEGDKVPVATGSYSTDNATSQTQFTYLDVGMNFNAKIEPLGNGVSLRSKVEESSLGTPVTITNVTEPVVRQSVLTSEAQLTLDKPVMLGSIDLPNTTHRIDIAVVLEAVK